MRADLERRDADVRRRQARRHRLVRYGAGHGDVGQAGDFMANAGELGTVADEDRAEIRPALADHRARGARQVDGAMPGPERPGEDRHGRRRPPIRRFDVETRAEPLRVRAPFEPHDLGGGRLRGRIAALGVTIRSAR